MIPFVDIKAQHQTLRREIEDAIASVVATAQFVKGPTVEAFEFAFADYCSTEFAVGVANGTDALRLALQAIGIGSGDVVLTVPNTFIATAEAISHLGAEVRFVDVDHSTWLMDAQRLGDEIEDAKAVIPVHLFGHVVDHDTLAKVAGDHQVPIVEDAAQAHGARFKGRPTGSLGIAAAFSFYPGKNLGAYGDAGAVVTSDSEIAERVRMLADHGRYDKYAHEIVGWNSRLDSLQAAVLMVKLHHLADFNERRRTLAGEYQARLRDVNELRWPAIVDNTEPVHHLMVIAVPKRDELRKWLLEKGISTGVHYPTPLHLQPAYRHLGYSRGDFPVTEELAASIISLPMYPELTDVQLDTVCIAVREFFAAR
jgi:dTDP-4-amino-4,6-dideoxygalactose transaminase